MCVILPKLKQFAFTQASFSSLSDIHECSGSLSMALVGLGLYKWTHTQTHTQRHTHRETHIPISLQKQPDMCQPKAGTAHAWFKM